MIGKEKIDELKKTGEVVITAATFKKRVTFRNTETETFYYYNGVEYNRNDCLLTYGMEQYHHLCNR